METISRRRNRETIVTIAVCITLVVLVWIAFGQTIHHGFLNYDDNEYVYDNPGVKQGLSWTSIGWAFTHSYSANWHPLTTISHMLDCQLYGLRPWGHHLTNLLLHTLAAILMFFAFRKLTLSIWPSALIAALFAIHPQRVESVAWVAERKDVLSGVLFALTLLAYANYARSRRRSTAKYLAAIVAFALGLLCKPTLVTVPFVLLLLDYWPLNRMRSAKCAARSSESRDHRSDSTGRVTSTSRLSAGLSRRNRMKAEVSAKQEQFNPATLRGLIVEKVPFFVLSVLSCFATVIAQADALEATRRLTLIERAANALISYGTYLRQAFYPLNLAVFYPFPTDVAVVSQLLPLVLLLTSISLIAFWLRKRLPFLAVGWLWFVGMLVPMIGLIQVGSQAHADRYTYLSQVGLYIAVAVGAFQLLRQNRLAFAALGFLLISALTGLSFQETRYWKDTQTLWRRALATTEDNYVAHNNLGHNLTLQGNFTEAIPHFRKAIAIKRDYAEAYNNLGNALLDSDQLARRHKPADDAAPSPAVPNDQTLDEAVADYREALRVKPEFAEAWTNLGTALLQKGQLDEAIGDYTRALEIAPELPEANGNLGNALLEKGQLDKALYSYSKAIRLKPDYADAHYGISLVLLKTGRATESIEHLNEVIKLDPEYPEAHHNLGVILGQKGEDEAAIAQYLRAVSLNPYYAQAESDLGNALLRKGKTDEAIGHLQKAVTIAPNYPEPYNDLGSAFMQKQQVDTAVEWYEKAIRLKQNYPEAHSNLGSAYFQKKEFDKAIEQYKAALYFKPDSAPVQYNLGNAWIAKGVRAEAINCYQAALKAQPNYAAAKQQLRKLGVQVSD